MLFEIFKLVLVKCHSCFKGVTLRYLEMIICLGRQTLRNKGKNKPKKNKGWSRMVNDGHGWSRMVRDGKDGQRWIRLTHMANDKSQEITEASLNQSTQLSLVPCL